MSRSNIGRKIQSLATVILVVGLIYAAITFFYLAWALYETLRISVDDAVYFGLMSGRTLSSVISVANTVPHIVRPIILFYCLKGFGHLIINSDKLVKLQRESVNGFMNRDIDETATWDVEAGGERA